MNFLVHIFLSGKNKDIILGNFIADMVKGRQIQKYSPEIVKGIMLHREIDRFTDNHPIVALSKKRLRNKYRHYSGVIVDMYYDHFLAKNWNDYSEEPINRTAGNAYKILLSNVLILPPKVKRILPFMIAENWLVNYANPESLQRNFEGMSKRTAYKSGMENAVQDLLLDYNSYYAEFAKFFPELSDYIKGTSRLEL